MAKEKQNTTGDEHAGHGGSYFIDKDGKKTLVHRTAPQAAPDAPVAKAAERK